VMCPVVFCLVQDSCSPGPNCQRPYNFPYCSNGRIKLLLVDLRRPEDICYKVRSLSDTGCFLLAYM
jgi:hypothetical protein